MDWMMRHLEELRARAKNLVDNELVTKKMVIKAESNAAYLRRLINMGSAWAIIIYNLSKSLILSPRAASRPDGQ